MGKELENGEVMPETETGEFTDLSIGDLGKLKPSSAYLTLQRWARKMHIEERGIERVLPEEKTESSLLNVGTMWMSANLVVSSIALGVLGPALFFTGFVDGVLVVVFFNLLAVLPVAYFSCFGMRLGLRQMVLTRYSWGLRGLGAPFVCCLNILACVGWTANNTIAGAQLLTAINGNVGLWAGCLIIVLLTGVVTTAGYKAIHYYERYAWIPMFIIFIIIAAEIGKSGAFVEVPYTTGPAEAGAVMSFGAAIFGYGIGWCSYAADYTVYQPTNRNPYYIFFFVYAGLSIPLILAEILGVAAGQLVSNGDPDFLADPDALAYFTAYTNNSVGGLIGQILAPLGGFGSFCMVILSLSIIANNVPNIYSASLTIAALHPIFQAVPRFIWNIIVTLITLAIAIPASTHFAEFFDNLLTVLAYWLAIYSTVLIEEHLIFKRNNWANYDLEIWDTASALPWGLGAWVAFGFGWMGAMLGMAELWYVSPIAYAIDPPFGADLGFELAAAFTAIAYPVSRYLERRWLKK